MQLGRPLSSGTPTPVAPGTAPGRSSPVESASLDWAKSAGAVPEITSKKELDALMTSSVVANGCPEKSCVGDWC